jgi:hypothetical protein
MKRQRYILTFLLVLTLGTVFAHQDFWVTKDFGNVKVRILTGFEYEEINKVLIFGQLAEQFSKQLNYSEPIFLDFKHNYTENCDPDYFISYDKGKIQDSNIGAEKGKDFLIENSIVIRQISRQFDAESTLKLVEYAILNLGQIKSTQKEIEYNKNYCWWIIYSIDTALINKQLLVQSSDKLKDILKTKTERPEKDFKYGITYCFTDSSYDVTFKEYNEPDTILLSLKNIYQISRPTNSFFAFVFDSDSSFYFIDSRKNASKRQLITGTYGHDEPFDIEYIGGNKYSINFWCYSKEPNLRTIDRTLIYQSDKDKLIQDLDKLIEDKQ